MAASRAIDTKVDWPLGVVVADVQQDRGDLTLDGARRDMAHRGEAGEAAGAEDGDAVLVGDARELRQHAGRLAPQLDPDWLAFLPVPPIPTDPLRRLVVEVRDARVIVGLLGHDTVVADVVKVDEAAAAGTHKDFAQPLVRGFRLVEVALSDESVVHLANAERQVFGVLVKDIRDLLQEESVGGLRTIGRVSARAGASTIVTARRINARVHAARSVSKTSSAFSSRNRSSSRTATRRRRPHLTIRT